MRRKCLYRNSYSSNDWKRGFCLLLTGGMMSHQTAVIEKMDGSMESFEIENVKFDDDLVGRDGECGE